MSEQLFYVEADYNDADYVSQLSSITDSDLQKFEPLIEAIKKCPGKNWITSDYIREYLGELPPKKQYSNINPDIIEEFEDYVPYGEYGVHTITKISILEGEIQLL